MLVPIIFMFGTPISMLANVVINFSFANLDLAAFRSIKSMLSKIWSRSKKSDVPKCASHRSKDSV